MIRETAGNTAEVIGVSETRSKNQLRKKNQLLARSIRHRSELDAQNKLTGFLLARQDCCQYRPASYQSALILQLCEEQIELTACETTGTLSISEDAGPSRNTCPWVWAENFVPQVPSLRLNGISSTEDSLVNPRRTISARMTTIKAAAYAHT